MLTLQEQKAMTAELAKKVPAELLERMDNMVDSPSTIQDAISTMQEASNVIDALTQELKKMQLKVHSLEAGKERMLAVMRDYDVVCGECESELSNDELEYALCTDCARLLS